MSDHDTDHLRHLLRLTRQRLRRVELHADVTNARLSALESHLASALLTNGELEGSTGIASWPDGMDLLPGDDFTARVTVAKGDDGRLYVHISEPQVRSAAELVPGSRDG